MGFEKYTPQTARGIAARVALHYAQELAAVHASYPGIPVEWLVGLTGMENPQCREWPNAGSTRFEAGVFAHLAGFAAGKPGSYNGMSAALLRGVGLDVVRALSTSYGQTQIMGYEMCELYSGPDDANKGVNVLLGAILKGEAGVSDGVAQVARDAGLDPAKDLYRGATLADLRNPALHYFFTAWWLTHDLVLARLVKLAGGRADGAWGSFNQLCHYWNCGRLWDGNPAHIHTYSPYYMANCEAVARAFQSIPVTQTGLPSHVVLQQAGISSAQPITSESPSGAETAQQPTEASMSNSPTPDDLGRYRPPAGMFPGETATTGLTAGMFPGEATTALNSELSDPQVSPPDSISTIGVKPGWQTSEAHIVAALGIIASTLSAFGLHALPEHMNNAADSMGHLFAIVGPLAAYVPLAWNFITSRGKLKSNAVNATALVSLGQSQAQMQGILGTNGVVGSILGGANWKDPSRYVGIAKTVGGVAGGPVGGIIGQILGGPSGANAQTESRTEFTDEILEQVFTALQNRIASVEARQSTDATNKPTSGPAPIAPTS